MHLEKGIGWFSWLTFRCRASGECTGNIWQRIKISHVLCTRVSVEVISCSNRLEVAQTLNPPAPTCKLIALLIESISPFLHEARTSQTVVKLILVNQPRLFYSRSQHAYIPAAFALCAALTALISSLFTRALLWVPSLLLANL